MFIPRKGFKFVHSDASQSELRILGWYSQEPTLVDAATNNYDLHCANCSAIFGIPFEEVYSKYKVGDQEISKLRRDAKNIGFAMIYGAGWRKISEMIGGKMSRDKVEELIDKYFKRLPNVLEWKETVHRLAYNNDKQFFTCYGRRRVLNALPSPSELAKLRRLVDAQERANRYRTTESKQLHEWESALREGLNFVIQSSSVEYLNYGLVELDTSLEIDHSRAFPLLQTHDSVDVEVEDDYVDEFSGTLKQILQKPKNPIDINMKFDIEIKNSLA